MSHYGDMYRARDAMSADEYNALAGKKGNKYKAERTTVDGITFDSKMEARRYEELRQMESAGIIRDLVLQPRYPLVVNGHKIGTYVADFEYYDKEKDMVITEDVKGVKTPAYKLKKKLVWALHGVEIVEVTA